MSKGKIGASIKPSEPVQKMVSEGPLDQMLGVHVDENMTSPVFLSSVLNENDLLERCPVNGQIDFAKEMGGDSIKDLLGDIEYVTNDLFLNPSGEGLQKFSDVVNDRFGIQNADWLNDPDSLIWNSPLLAQLQAKFNAITHFINDPSTIDFAGDMSDELKTAIAGRARELSARLKDQALGEIDTTAEDALTQSRKSADETKARFSKYVVTKKEAKDAGGLTEAEVDDLCKGIE